MISVDILQVGFRKELRQRRQEINNRRWKSSNFQDTLGNAAGEAGAEYFRNTVQEFLTDNLGEKVEQGLESAINGTLGEDLRQLPQKTLDSLQDTFVKKVRAPTLEDLFDKFPGLAQFTQNFTAAFSGLEGLADSLSALALDILMPPVELDDAKSSIQSLQADLSLMRRNLLMRLKPKIRQNASQGLQRAAADTATKLWDKRRVVLNVSINGTAREVDDELETEQRSILVSVAGAGLVNCLGEQFSTSFLRG